MVGHEDAVTPSLAEMDFIRQRSKVMSEHFMNFVIAHELDMDADTWPSDLRAQFDHDAGVLIEEWKRKAQRLFPPPAS